MTEDDSEQLEKLRLEIRRGAIVLAVLSLLRSEHYGYSLRKTLGDMGVPIDEGTLYPLVRRLEKQGLLTSEWREEDKRRKRFYRLSPTGERVFAQLASDWQQLGDGVNRLLMLKHPKGAKS